MKLREVMSEGVVVIRPDVVVAEAARKMRDADTGFLPVCNGDKILGTLTDRDIVVRVIAMGLDPKLTLISDVMTKDVIYAFEDQDATDAAHIMNEQQVRRIVVLDNNKLLVGVVSLGDLWSRTSTQDVAADVMEKVANTRGNETRH